MATEQRLSYRDIALREYVKCSTDYIYFIRTYFTIQSELTGGRDVFKLFPFQEDVLHDIHENREVIILKSRQMGISTLCAAYALWLILFHSDKVVAIAANQLDTSIGIIQKVVFAYEELPSFLSGEYEQVGKKTKKKTVKNKSIKILRLKNGSSIKAYSSNSNSLRSITASWLIMDEAAMIPRAEEMWKGASPTLTTGGSITMLSTPKGVGSFFHQKWQDAVAGRNNMKHIVLMWNLHPHRDQQWYEAEYKKLGPTAFGQEYGCNFLTSGETVIDSDTILRYEQFVRQPLEMTGPEKSNWIFEHPRLGINYCTIVDTAKGDGSDYSTIVVFRMDTNSLVYESNVKMPPAELSRQAISVSFQYNNALLVIENTGIGFATCTMCEELGYRNLFRSKPGVNTIEDYMRMANSGDNTNVGFSNNHVSRPRLIDALINALETKLVDVPSSRFVEQLKTFVWINGKAQAAKRCNDDLVISVAIYCFLQKTLIRYHGEVTNMSRHTWSHVRRYVNGVDSSSPTPSHRNVVGHMDAILKAAGYDTYDSVVEELHQPVPENPPASPGITTWTMKDMFKNLANGNQ